MQVSKLFRVLVLGGAAMASPSCSDDPQDSDEEDRDGAHDASHSASSTSGASGGNGSGAGGRTSGGHGGATPSTGPGGGGLECSDPPAAEDPCGCPCCWADPSCPNTDESCCAGFCVAGDDGLGCCGQ
jgi:hypothetical protein